MARLNGWMRTNSVAAGLIVGTVALVVLGAAFLGIARATDRPSFCGSACHEMGPYHDAWSVGPHKDIICIECHVDESETARLKHKFEALKEVAAHVTGDTSFPRKAPAVVPDERCTRCHESVDSDIPGFNHSNHARNRACVECHADAGHNVTPDALQLAGILNTATVPPTHADDPTKAKADEGAADLVNHVTVGCSRCHTMSKTPCSQCHTTKHKARGECSTCHKPDFEFVFSHPASGVDCASCHKRPAKHTDEADCTTTCHPAPGKSWKYPHKAGAQCTDCHERPEKHRAGSCATCHKKTGKSWAFTHPANNSKCASCHNRPEKHRAGSCASCHKKTGRSWAFTHPSGRSSCSACHTRRSGHSRGQCSTCHRRTGASWAFTHPSGRSSCSACHARRSGHSRGQCSNCHSRPGRSWAFSHPRIRGGEHTSRTYSCKHCHPRGYSSYTCIDCHDNATRGGDD